MNKSDKIDKNISLMFIFALFSTCFNLRSSSGKTVFVGEKKIFLETF